MRFPSFFDNPYRVLPFPVFMIFKGDAGRHAFPGAVVYDPKISETARSSDSH